MARPYRPVGENDMANPLIMRELRNIPQLKKGLTHYGRVGPWPEGATPLCPGDLAKKAKLMRRPKRQECYMRNAVIAEEDPAYSAKPITKWGLAPIRVRFSLWNTGACPRKHCEYEHRKNTAATAHAKGKPGAKAAAKAHVNGPPGSKRKPCSFFAKGDIGSDTHANGLTQRLAPRAGHAKKLSRARRRDTNKYGSDEAGSKTSAAAAPIISDCLSNDSR